MSELTNYAIALYICLSTEDSKVGSFSIENQKHALHQYVDAMEDVRDVEVLEFMDNGYTGTQAVSAWRSNISSASFTAVISPQNTRVPSM